jgi:type II secretory pathway pseudopilin PulG
VDPSVVIAIVGAIASIGGIFVANRYTSRIAKNAQIATQQIEEKKLDVASWQDQVKSWRDDVKQLRELRVQDRTEYENELHKAMTRIDALEEARRADARERAADRAIIDAMGAWGRVVVAILNKAEIVYPMPPPGIADTDPGSGRLRPIAPRG